MSHEQNGGNDSSSVFFKVIFESVPVLDLDHSPSENPPYTFAGRSWDLCSLWSDVCQVEFVLKTNNEITIYQKDMSGAQTSL